MSEVTVPLALDLAIVAMGTIGACLESYEKLMLIIVKGAEILPEDAAVFQDNMNTVKGLASQVAETLQKTKDAI